MAREPRAAEIGTLVPCKKCGLWLRSYRLLPEDEKYYCPICGTKLTNKRYARKDWKGAKIDVQV